ncbi:hypothetical protein DL96DRAFT_1819125 [Flagelloscypha sp. PMI_526]|nr:hypothetical protein DL96DRAFT_1819125 [Flagelloscypha sp. PMI_526]
MVFRRLVRVAKRYPRTAGLTVYLLIGILPFITWFWNSDPIPTFIADHPEISFSPVSGWYGPGTWLALVLTIVSGTATLFRAAYVGSPPPIWSPDIIAVVVYCLASCWNLKKTQQAVQGTEGELSTSILPALVAANRAVIISGGVLQVYALLLIPHLFSIPKPSFPIRIAVAQFVLTWTASFIPMFVFPPEMNDSSFPKYFPCLETDFACQDGRQLTQTFVFFSQKAVTISGDTLRQVLSCYSVLDPFLFFEAFAILQYYIIVAAILYHKDNWLQGLAWGLPMSLIITFCGPMIIWIIVVPSVFITCYPLVCIIEFGTVLVLAAIPRSGLFPHSGISLGEVDQIGSLLVIVVYHSVQGLSTGLAQLTKAYNHSALPDEALRLYLAGFQKDLAKAFLGAGLGGRDV